MKEPKPISMLMIKKLELSIAKDEYKRYPYHYQAGKVKQAQEEVNKILSSIHNPKN